MINVLLGSDAQYALISSIVRASEFSGALNNANTNKAAAAKAARAESGDVEVLIVDSGVAEWAGVLARAASALELSSSPPPSSLFSVQKCDWHVRK